MLLEAKKFEFADFLLDAKEKILLRGGKPLSITPKSFQLLLVLVENHGHLVEKDELMNSVWADSFVEEANLAFTIGLLRKALNDNAQNPRFIETVPKRGYRFIAEVKSVESQKEKFEKFDLIDNSALLSNGEISSTVKKTLPVGETDNQSAADWRGEANADDSEDSDNAFKISSEIRNTISDKTDTNYLSGRNKIITVAAVCLLLAVSATARLLFFFRRKCRGWR